MVVQLVSVDMFNGRFVLWVVIRTERLCYKAADKIIAHFAVDRESYTLISFVVHKGLQYSWLAALEALNPS